MADTPAYNYRHPHPAVAVDCAVFGLGEGELRLLLIRRGAEPQRGSWALPGGFVRIDEDLESAARRELAEESGVREVYLEQLYTFGRVDRDPRERVVAVAYYAIVKRAEHPARADGDAQGAEWFPLSALPALAFDHAEIAALALKRLQAKLRYQPVAFEFLPELFSLTQLQRLYETVLRRPLDKRNFRKKVEASGVVAPSGETERGVPHRAARLYRFDREGYAARGEPGIDFGC